jgi:hypothetical protein
MDHLGGPVSTGMDEPLRIIAEQEGGVFLYGEAIRAGYTDKQVQRMRRSGAWHRVRHGAYCFGDHWTQLDVESRHLVRAHAVRRTTPGDIAFSHTTALIAHGVAVWDADLDVVHLTRLDNGVSRCQRDVRHHVGRCPSDDVTAVSGLRVTTPPRAVLETATITDTQHALVSVDNALWQNLCTEEELWRRFEQEWNHRPGSRRLHIVLPLATGKAQSVAESLAMHLFWRQSIPAPEQQWDVRDNGRLIGTTDFAWPKYGLLGEFDGKQKYLRYVREGEEPGDVVFREKRREDDIRRLTGWMFIRLVWADLFNPIRTAAYLRRLMGIGS